MMPGWNEVTYQRFPIFQISLRHTIGKGRFVDVCICESQDYLQVLGL